jgi:hypothetical protein
LFIAKGWQYIMEPFLVMEIVEGLSHLTDLTQVFLLRNQLETKFVVFVRMRGTDSTKTLWPAEERDLPAFCQSYRSNLTTIWWIPFVKCRLFFYTFLVVCLLYL